MKHGRYKEKNKCLQGFGGEKPREDLLLRLGLDMWKILKSSS
jgi:hypothetical protein